MSREENLAVAEAYLRAWRARTCHIAFADDITFEGPRVPMLVGRHRVVGFLTRIWPAVKDMRIKQHIERANTSQPCLI
jgi:nuclear transport factor 2 (NTF2) superfamily protein